ncbi:hypothetical protein [Nocardioides sp.]|uniref:hypothetical protein n=1 Tax=Nocardioides sp. TaxID=35761 RepID=UPI003783D9A1
MRTSETSSVRRKAVVVAAALAAGVGLTLVAAPAQAATALSGTAGAFVGTNNAGGTCSNAGGDDAQSTTAFSSNGAVRTRSVASSGTITDSGDAGDVTTWSASAKMTLRAGQTSSTSSLSVSAALKARVTSAQGSMTGCDPSASAGAQVIGVLSLAHAGWVQIDATVPRGAQFVAAVIPLSDSLPVQTVQYSAAVYHSRLWFDSGQYVVQVVAQVEADTDPATVGSTAVNGTLTASLKALPGGAATGAAAGPGRAYVALPGGVGCVDGTVAVPFTGKAGKAASATFYVNGKKRATVSSPRPGTAVILRGVGATSETTVRAVVKPRTGKAVSVSRSYLACS